MAGPKKPAPKAPAPKPKKRPDEGPTKDPFSTRFSERREAAAQAKAATARVGASYERASRPTVRPKNKSVTVGDAVNAVGRFASEVSTNYARGVGEAQKAVGRATARVNAPSPIKTAMNNPEDNPLKNLLRGGKPRRPSR